MKRFRAALKEKSNWPSLITLALILACSVFSFWDTKFAEQARSAAFALVAVEFFIMLVVHLEEVKAAVREIGRPKGLQLKKWDSNLEATMIAEAKEELFFCGYDLSRLLHHRVDILAASDKLKHVRLLAMNIDDEKVYAQFENTFGRPPGLDSIKHLGCFSSKPNIEIRMINYPLIIHITAMDMGTNTGGIRVGIPGYKKSGSEAPGMHLIPTDVEWYDYYKGQIELIWEAGNKWTPPTKEGTS